MNDSLQRLRVLSRVMDNAVRLPGTDFRIGLDALFGLIPGVGDLAGGVVTGYTLLLAQRLGAPRTVLLRMLWNTLVDTLCGSVPVLGDLFDAGFKSNARNVELLEKYQAAPATTTRSSVLFLAVVLLALAAIIGGGIYIVITILEALF